MMEPWTNPDFRWLDDPFDIPGNLTRGKSAINIQILPLVGLTSTTNQALWTASQYQVVSEVAGFTTGRGPGPIADLAAAGGQLNSVTLSWVPDSAEVGVAAYQIYGSSIDPSVAVTPANLVGESPVPGFQHTGLGLQQQWYYRIRAVATNGQVGPLSEL
jgi:predicted phage tail protein